MRPGGRWSLVRAGDRNPQNKYLFLVSSPAQTPRSHWLLYLPQDFLMTLISHPTIKKKTSGQCSVRKQRRHTAPGILSLTGSERSRDLLRNSISLRHQTHQSQCSCYIGVPTPTRMKESGCVLCLCSIHTASALCVAVCSCVADDDPD